MKTKGYGSRSQSQYANETAFAAVTDRGKVFTWGDSFSGGDSSGVSEDLNSGVNKIFQNKSSFAALKEDGSVVTWGDPNSGGDSTNVSDQLFDIKEIYSNATAYMAVRGDGALIGWGNRENGGSGFNNDDEAAHFGSFDRIDKIVATENAFALLTTDGNVYTCGQDREGGESTFNNKKTSYLNGQARDIVASDKAFAVLTHSGDVTSWGETSHGGKTSSKQDKTLVNIREVYATGSAFAALTNDGRVYTWGDSNSGGSQPSLTSSSSQVRDVFSNKYAFAALKQDGSIFTWGDSNYGGDNHTYLKNVKGVRDIYSTEGAFIAVGNDGRIDAVWGNPGYGGYLSEDDLPDNYGPIRQVVATDRSFALLDESNNLLSWGDQDSGGDGYTHEINTGEFVQEIFANGSAIAGTVSDGTIYAWGMQSSGGDFTYNNPNPDELLGYGEKFVNVSNIQSSPRESFALVEYQNNNDIDPNTDWDQYGKYGGYGYFNGPESVRFSYRITQAESDSATSALGDVESPTPLYHGGFENDNGQAWADNRLPSLGDIHTMESYGLDEDNSEAVMLWTNTAGDTNDGGVRLKYGKLDPFWEWSIRGVDTSDAAVAIHGEEGFEYDGAILFPQPPPDLLIGGVIPEGKKWNMFEGGWTEDPAWSDLNATLGKPVYASDSTEIAAALSDNTFMAYGSRSTSRQYVPENLSGIQTVNSNGEFGTASFGMPQTNDGELPADYEGTHTSADDANVDLEPQWEWALNNGQGGYFYPQPEAETVTRSAKFYNPTGMEWNSFEGGWIDEGDWDEYLEPPVGGSASIDSGENVNGFPTPVHTNRDAPPPETTFGKDPFFLYGGLNPSDSSQDNLEGVWIYPMPEPGTYEAPPEAAWWDLYNGQFVVDPSTPWKDLNSLTGEWPAHLTELSEQPSTQRVEFNNEQTGEWVHATEIYPRWEWAFNNGQGSWFYPAPPFAAIQNVIDESLEDIVPSNSFWDLQNGSFSGRNDNEDGNYDYSDGMSGNKFDGFIEGGSNQLAVLGEGRSSDDKFVLEIAAESLTGGFGLESADITISYDKDIFEEITADDITIGSCLSVANAVEVDDANGTIRIAAASLEDLDKGQTITNQEIFATIELDFDEVALQTEAIQAKYALSEGSAEGLNLTFDIDVNVDETIFTHTYEEMAPQTHDTLGEMGTHDHYKNRSIMSLREMGGEYLTGGVQARLFEAGINIVEANAGFHLGTERIIGSANNGGGPGPATMAYNDGNTGPAIMPHNDAITGPATMAYDGGGSYMMENGMGGTMPSNSDGSPMYNNMGGVDYHATQSVIKTNLVRRGDILTTQSSWMNVGNAIAEDIEVSEYVNEDGATNALAKYVSHEWGGDGENSIESGKFIDGQFESSNQSKSLYTDIKIIGEAGSIVDLSSGIIQLEVSGKSFANTRGSRNLITFAGDLNYDGRVSMKDLAYLNAGAARQVLDDQGEVEAASLAKDVDANADGKIDLTDLSVLDNDWGKTLHKEGGLFEGLTNSFGWNELAKQEVTTQNSIGEEVTIGEHSWDNSAFELQNTLEVGNEDDPSDESFDDTAAGAPIPEDDTPFAGPITLHEDGLETDAFQDNSELG